VSIVIPCKGIDEQHLSDEAVFQRAMVKSIPADALNPQTTTVDQIPTDRTFRNAWEHGGDKIRVNMERARGIHLDRIRAVRDEALTKLDVETMIAVGKGDTGARDAVEAQKQKLRDIPQTLDLSQATTPEELKAIWPAELKGAE